MTVFYYQYNNSAAIARSRIMVMSTHVFSKQFSVCMLRHPSPPNVPADNTHTHTHTHTHKVWAMDIEKRYGTVYMFYIFALPMLCLRNKICRNYITSSESLVRRETVRKRSAIILPDLFSKILLEEKAFPDILQWWWL